MSVKIIVFMLALFTAGRVEAKAVATSVTKVVVYRTRALVSREGKVAVPLGTSRLIIPDLPPRLRDDSVRVSGRSSGGITVTGTEVRETFLSEARRTRIKKLEADLDLLKIKGRTQENKLSSLALEREFVASIKAASAEKISREMLLKEPDPAGWKQVLDFIGSSSLALGEKRNRIGVEKEKLDRKIKALEEELNQARAVLSRRAKEIVVTVRAERAGPLRLEASYLVPNASWQPVYDLRTEGSTSRAELTYRAQVRQKTGESWDGVQLVLSTARPAAGARPEELEPWYISLAPPAPAGRLLYLKESPAAAPVRPAKMNDRAEAGAAPGLNWAAADLVRAGGLAVFQIAARQTIPSDSNFHQVVISSRDFKAEYEYIAIPVENEFAYQLARFKNKAGYPLLAGRVSLFRGGDYIGVSRLDTVAPGGKGELYLGIDREVKVERRLIREGTESGGIFSGNTGYKNFSYRIEVENLSPRSVPVTVWDRRPVSRSPELEVKLVKVKPKPVVIKVKEQPGVMAWKFQLPAGKKKIIRYEYTIKYPRDKVIRGL